MAFESRDNHDRTESTRQSLTLLLAIIATAASELAAAGAAAWSAGSAVRLAFLVGAALAARQWFRRRTAKRVWGEAALAAAILVPVLGRPFLLAWLPPALAGAAGLEFSILAGLRNLALLSAAMGKVPRMSRIAGLGSLFVMLFAFTLGGGGWLLLATLAYVVVAVLWLMAGHWEQLRGPTDDGSPLPRAPALFLAACAVVAGILGVLLYPADLQSVVQMIAQVPGSMREGRDSEARKRLEDAHRSALAHLTMQKYGPSNYAAEREKDPAHERTQDSGKDESEGMWRHDRPGSGRRGLGVNEEFSIVRRPSSEDQPDGYDPRQILFHTKGRGPRHIPVVSYDRFDGAAWQAEPRRFAPHITADVVGENMWLTVTHPPNFPLEPAALAEETQRINNPWSLAAAMEDPVGWGRASVRHMWGDVPDSRLLAPYFIPIARDYAESLLAEEPNGASEAEYLLSPYDGALIQQRLDQTPGLRVRLQSLMHESPRMRDLFFSRYLTWRKQQHMAGLPDELAQLLEQWTGETPRGWPQIEALVSNLRRHARNDPQATVPPDVDDPIAYFLLESRAGPDYLFASAAAVLLRSLGYPSRMVGGFYAQPNLYRRLAGNTPIRADDVHYWTQTQLPDGTWANLEPTPEYRSPDPPSGMPQAVPHRWNAFLRWLKASGAVLAMALAGAVGLLVFRRHVAERVATFVWLLRRRGPISESVPATWRLLERRAKLAGRPRPPGKTLRAWEADLFAAQPEIDRCLAALAEMADWLAHGQSVADAPQGANGSAARLCRDAGRLCTVAALRRTARQRCSAAAPDRCICRKSGGELADMAPSRNRCDPARRCDGQSSLPRCRNVPPTPENHDQTARKPYRLVS